MHIKTAVHTLTQCLHRLGWRTEQALQALDRWRTDQCTREQFLASIDQLLIIDQESLTSDELADLALYVETLTKIKQQSK